MDKEKYRSPDWQENKLKELYYAFGTSEQEGLKLFLNLVFELSYNNPSFLEKVYNTIDEIKQEAIYEITETTLEWVKFWRSFSYTDYEKFLNQLEKLKELKDEDCLSKENLGRLYFELGFLEGELKNHENAAVNYEECIRLLPDWSWTYNNLGVVYKKLGRKEEAIASYQKAIELDPKEAAFYTNLGIFYRYSGHQKEAIAAYQKAIELNPKYASAHNGLGYLYLIAGKLGEAKIHFEDAISIDSEDYCVLVNLGIIYFQLGKREEAQSYFRLALEKCPMSSVHGRFTKIDVLIGLEKKKEALTLLQETFANFKILQTETGTFFQDWNLLATSPEPPAGIHEFIEQAKEVLSQET